MASAKDKAIDGIEESKEPVSRFNSPFAVGSRMRSRSNFESTFK